MTIGERLKMMRGSLTQAEVAERLGMKQQSYRVYETDGSAPGAGLIQRICGAFNVSADWLLGMEEQKGKIVATNSAIVIGEGTAINGNVSATDGKKWGKEPMCRKCPYKKKLERIAREAKMDEE